MSWYRWPKPSAVLINPNNANAERDAATVRDAARAIGVQILVGRAVVESDCDTVFGTLPQERLGQLLVNTDVFFTTRRNQTLPLEPRHAPPVMPTWPNSPLAGA